MGGCEVDGWLLGRCINLYQHCEVLKRGWYPQGFTQLLSEQEHAVSVKSRQAIDADVSHGTLRFWNDVAQDRRKNWWVSSGSGVFRGVSPRLGEGTSHHRSKPDEAMAVYEQGGIRMRPDPPVLSEISSRRSAALHMNGELSSPKVDGIDSSADGADMRNKCEASY